MYAVSAEYISAMNSPIQRHRIQGTIGGVRFDSSDVLKDSFVLSNQCSDSKDLTLGGVYVGSLKFTLTNDLGITRGTWIDKKITFDFEQLLNSSPEVWEAVPCGVFTISEANHSEKGVEIVAYDNMSKLDKSYPATEVNGNIFAIMTYACTRCGVEFGLSEEECGSLPNGHFPLSIYPNNDCKTWRDVVHYVAQVIGGFACAGRDGKIYLRRFGIPTGYTVDSRKRLTGSKFSDYITNYTGLSVVNMAEKVTRYVHVTRDDGLTVNLGNNPLLQYGTEETIESILNDILSVINEIKFTPFSSSMVGNPAFDLGDLITYTEGTAGVSSVCCVMSYTWKLNKSYSVNGFGKNPSLATAQSKAEKDVSGLTQQTKSDTVTFFTYENVTPSLIHNEELQVMHLSATNTKTTFVEFWIELKVKVQLDEVEEGEVPKASLKFRYVADDYEEIYRPEMTYYHDGVYVIGLQYYWKLVDVKQHQFNVYLESSGGTVSIEVGDIHALLKGQGMTEGNAWDGLVEVSDVFGLSLVKEMTFNFVDNGAEFKTQIPTPINAVDSFGLILSREIEINFTDDLSIITQTGIFDLITEDGRPLTDQNDNPYQTNGGN